MKANFRNILVVVLLVIAFIITAVLLSGGNRKTEKIENYSQLVALFQKDNEAVTSFWIDQAGNIEITTYPLTQDAEGHAVVNKQGEKKVYPYKLVFDFQVEEINQLAKNHAPYLENYNYKEEAVSVFSWLLAYLPTILILIIMIVFFVVMMNQINGKGGKINAFSRSHAKVSYNEKNAVKFSDVAGAEEEKQELEEVVEFLKNPEKFIKLGARIPRGVLLVGPPGTGKTLLAKAVAGEAGVPFFSISGSDFVEMYVGVGASRVRDLFENARKSPASIIFIDEIDAVGRQRGAGLGGGHDEREQTLNQLLVEMDGFGTHEGIIVMAATNRPDILDSALLRPGRFDRQITVNYPDMKGREAILQVHTRNKPLEGDVDLEKIARTTVGFTGADLANLMNEAALLAARRGKSLIGMQDVEDAFLRVVLGPQKKSKQRLEDDVKITAYHEAGHAVTSFYCKHCDPVSHITIIPAGMAGGVTINAPVQDHMYVTKGQMLDRIVMGLGGRAAEALVMDDITGGASGDIQQVTSVARDMVTRYGMSERLGTVLYGSSHGDAEIFLGRDFGSAKNYSEATAAAIDEEIKRLLDEGYAKAVAILREHRDKLDLIAQYLMKYESMDGKQFRAAMEGDLTVEEVHAIEVERMEKSEQENRNAEEEARQRAQRAAEEESAAEKDASASSDTDGAGKDTSSSDDDDIFRF